ncbi:hypothetical protein ACFL0Q_08620 [Thermodesulfobacteriota bacterium]
MITDTTPEAEARQHEILLAMNGEQRLRLAMAWSDTIRDICWAGFRRRHPSATEKELRVMFLMELHGIDLEESRWRTSP